MYLNDLWKYELKLYGSWMWIRGSPLGNDRGTYGPPGVENEQNQPMGRGDYSMAYNSKNMRYYLFGGMISETGRQSDKMLQEMR